MITKLTLIAAIISKLYGPSTCLLKHRGRGTMSALLHAEIWASQVDV